MNKTYAVLLLSTLIGATAIAVTPAGAASTYTTYQMEFREATTAEARSVIDRAIGSGSVDVSR